MNSELLKRVWAPVITGTPCCSPNMSLMRLPSGELRCYGAEIHGYEDLTYVVQKSDDYGMSWRKEVVKNRTPGASTCSPWSGDWLCMISWNSWKWGEPKPQIHHNSYVPAISELPEDGMWLFRSTTGPDGDFTATKVCSDPVHVQRQPLALKKRKRWLLPGEERIDEFTRPVLFFSDDDGYTWEKRVLEYPPLHEIAWPHKGYRWRQPGVEPVVAEHADGTLQMLLRTSQDCHYQCFSYDGGESWTIPEPSPFYSVATMPNLLTLSDGRLLAIWNNTTPLPEVDHQMQVGLDDYTKVGGWEDVFTNRDALHAAISDDSGKSWRGFREIALNGIRNDSDFRTSGGNYAMFDRSVHQNMALELPENKVLVGYGQHPKCWRFLVFDLAWLDEKSRKEDFARGLDDWSTHQYVYSHHGGYRGRGHCSWNRRPGAALMPAPDGSFRESLQIARHPDSRLVFEKEGATWNFPAASKGEVKVQFTIMPGTAGMRISLCDRWFNPVDPVIEHFVPFTFEVDAIGRVNQEKMMEVGKAAELVIQYDQEAGMAVVKCGENTAQFPMLRNVTDAVSYIHFQSLAESADPFGVMIDSVAMEAR